MYGKGNVPSALYLRLIMRVAVPVSGSHRLTSHSQHAAFHRTASAPAPAMGAGSTGPGNRSRSLGLKPDELNLYNSLFDAADTTRKGYLTPPEVQQVLLRSKLPNASLAQVCLTAMARCLCWGCVLCLLWLGCCLLPFLTHSVSMCRCGRSLPVSVSLFSAMTSSWHAAWSHWLRPTSRPPLPPS